jgi:hypothetical protein
MRKMCIACAAAHGLSFSITHVFTGANICAALGL